MTNVHVSSASDLWKCGRNYIPHRSEHNPGFGLNEQNQIEIAACPASWWLCFLWLAESTSVIDAKQWFHFACWAGYALHLWFGADWLDIIGALNIITYVCNELIIDVDAQLGLARMRQQEQSTGRWPSMMRGLAAFLLSLQLFSLCSIFMLCDAVLLLMLHRTVTVVVRCMGQVCVLPMCWSSSLLFRSSNQTLKARYTIGLLVMVL